MVIPDYEIIKRLLIAFVIGALMGLERTYMKKPAGIKTQSIVCIVSTMVTLVSAYGLGGNDPSRIIANILTGVGFLAGGVIFSVGTNTGTTIKGLTTASAVWGAACIGIPIGLGHFWLAVLSFIYIEMALKLEWFLHKIKLMPHLLKDDETDDEVFEGRDDANSF